VPSAFDAAAVDLLLLIGFDTVSLVLILFRWFLILFPWFLKLFPWFLILFPWF